jgi:hypothetical protein
VTSNAKWIRRFAALSMCAAIVVAAFPSMAVAGAGQGLPKNAGLTAWQKAVDARIDLRLASLSALKIAISGATNLSSSDRSTLSALDASDISGLTALKTKTNAETTVAAVKADGHAMIVDYRIYMLVVPKVRFAIASDQEIAVLAKLQSAHDKLASIAATLSGQGKDVSSEQAELTDMAGKISAATSTLSGKASGLLAVQPSPDASTMTAAVAPVRTAVRGARADIKIALADAKTAAAGLKSAAA